MCYLKCIEKNSTPHLNPGEGACIDRCAIKYLYSQALVAKALKSLAEEDNMIIK